MDLLLQARRTLRHSIRTWSARSKLSALSKLGALALLAVPTWHAQAQADDSVAVLGIRSIEGDDDFARALTISLRRATSRVPGWRPNEADVSLAQMSLAHGCDQPDGACMAAIASDLEADRVIYGTVRRTASGDRYNFAVALHFFNASTNRIEESLTDTIAHLATQVDELRPYADRYVAQFAGQTQYGAIQVTTNVPGARVILDGHEVATTDAEGRALVQEVPVGRHRIEVRAANARRIRASVSVVANEETDLELAIEGAGPIPTKGRDLSWVPGTSLVVASAAFLGLMTYSMVTIKNINDDSLYQDFGNAIPRGLNRCKEVAAGNSFNFTADEANEVNRLCNRGQRHEILQYVFGGLAAAAGITGISLLIARGNKKADEDDRARLRLQPSFGLRDARIDASLTF